MLSKLVALALLSHRSEVSERAKSKDRVHPRDDYCDTFAPCDRDQSHAGPIAVSQHTGRRTPARSWLPHGNGAVPPEQQTNAQTTATATSAKSSVV
eukprot:6183931-Pleurochrysis_carterae.AAC.1